MTGVHHNFVVPKNLRIMRGGMAWGEKSWIFGQIENPCSDEERCLIKS